MTDNNKKTHLIVTGRGGGDQVQADWNQTDTEQPDYIKNKPSLATVATSGSYNDLTDKPTIPTQVQADWNETDTTDPSYIQNKPTILTQWFGTQAEYDLIDPKDPNTVYHIEGGAPVQSNWNESDNTSLAYIQNKPTIPAAQVNSDWNSNSGVSQILNKPSLATVATSGNYSDLNGTPTLATVATSGDYDDLQNKPTIPAAPVQSDWNEADSSSLAYIANKPTIPAAQVNADWNANSGVAQILNKPNITPTPPMATETLTFTLQGGTTKTIDFYTVPDYFYVENRTNSNGTFTIKKSEASAPSIQVYSSTDRINWTNMGTTSTSGITISMPANGKTYLKATANNWSNGMSNYNYFGTNYNYNIGGNIMSLLYGDSFVNKTTFPTNNGYVFYRLFANDEKIISAENLILPATTVTEYCYGQMFEACTALTTSPVTLPATTLAKYCYTSMFRYCRALTTAPALPATTLVQNCYQGMFASCTSLTTAPVLPATTLVSYCYNEMFNTCSSLNKITIYANNISATNCIKYWVNGVAATGDFYRLGSASFPSGASGIPSGWTTHTSL